MRRRLLILLPFLVGLIILGVIFRFVDLGEALAQIVRIGAPGSALFVLNIGLTFLAPAAGWHLLMRAEGIRVTPRQTFVSALMGHAFNLITPLLYLGGEPIRTFHIASVTGASKRQVVATIIVSKFQELSGLVLLMLVGTGIMIVTSDLSGRTVIAAVLAGVILSSFLIALLGMFLGNFKPTVKLLNLLIRCRVFPERLERARHKAEEMEAMVRGAFTQRWRTYVLSQMITMLSPLAQFLRPILFYGCLRSAGAPVPLPTLSEMSILFVLSQILFILPTTPAGLGVYEGGLIGIFALLAWPEHDGAAFSILIRIADLLYIALGAWLAVHYGMSSLLKSGMVPKTAAPTNAPVAPDEQPPPADGGPAA